MLWPLLILVPMCLALFHAPVMNLMQAPDSSSPNPLALAISASATTIDAGQSTVLSAIASGGAGSGYVYTWYNDNSCTLGDEISDTTVSPTSTTTYCVSATDGTETITGTVAVTVNPAPSVSITSSEQTTDAGQQILLTATATGGTPPYTYVFSGANSDDDLSSCTTTTTSIAATCQVSPSTTDTYSVLITDAVNVQSTSSPSVTVAINSVETSATTSTSTVASTSSIVPVTTVAPQSSSPLSISISPESAVIDSNQTLTFTATTQGGTAASYTWGNSGDLSVADGCGSSDSTCTLIAANESAPLGTSVSVSAVDSQNNPSNPASASVTINPPISGVYTSFGGFTDENDTSYMIIANANGGTPPYTYTWSLTNLGMVSGCGSADSTCIVKILNSDPTSVILSITDSATVPVTFVDWHAQVVLTPSLIIYPGNATTFTATTTLCIDSDTPCNTGTPAYDIAVPTIGYTWSVSGGSPPLSCSPTSSSGVANSYSFTCTLTPSPVSNSQTYSVGITVTSANAIWTNQTKYFDECGDYIKKVDGNDYWYNCQYSTPASATSTLKVKPIIKASPAISTTLTYSTITAGQTDTDTATLSSGTNPTGTVKFYTFTGSSCGGTPTLVSSSTVTGNGPYLSSSSAAYNTAGPYSWDAKYSGDSNNNNYTSTCETLTVNQATTALSTTLTNNPISAGQSDTDSATLTLGYNPTGSIAFYTSTSPTCASGTLVSTSSPVSGDNTYGPSSSVSYPNTGTFYWYAVYSGDTNNKGATSLLRIPHGQSDNAYRNKARGRQQRRRAGRFQLQPARKEQRRRCFRQPFRRI